MLHAVVMAGGSGTRFWPLSRAARPKQLLALVTEKALLVETVERLEGLVPEQRIHIITSEMYADRIRELLPGVPSSQVLAEPCGRDTAPCIGVAASFLVRQDPDAVMAVLPADHVVHPPQAFRQALAAAAAVVVARPATLVTFGIPPRRPATGYGYIERGESAGDVEGRPYYDVTSFREKPDLETAKRFLAERRFFWNGGIFVFRAAAILERIARYLPKLARVLPAVVDEFESRGSIQQESYMTLPKISIDYGVFEQDDDVVMLEASFTWDDVGSFAAMERVLPKDLSGNCGVGLSSTLDAKDNIIVSDDDHRIALVGVSDLVVVHTPDATLVCAKDDAERVKEMVALLQSRGFTGLL